MYSTKVTNDSIARLESFYKPKQPLREYSIPEVEDFSTRLSTAFDEKGRQTRSFSPEESSFIQNELILTKASFHYWAPRYATISLRGTGLGKLTLLESQSFVLSKMAEIEERIYFSNHQDGILINFLKGARQVGGSTLAESILAYLTTTQGNLSSLIAGDVPHTSSKMFDIYERIIDNLPFYLLPTITERVKDVGIKYDTGSTVDIGSGKSTRGTTGERGQLGRGATYALAHLSELSTWEDSQADQIDEALFPAIHRDPRVFVFLESTAKGRDNWWHKHWKVCQSPHSRFTQIFIPWYVEKRYSVEPPLDWTPSDETLAYAKRCEESSPKWIGRTLSLSKSQLYWYEITRSYYDSKDNLRAFLEEYGAVDDEECFQISGESIFSIKTIDRVVAQAKPILSIFSIDSPIDLSAATRREFSPEEVDLFTSANIPPGYGLTLVPKDNWRNWTTTDLMDHLLIWELPRKDQLYVVSVDTSGGVGQDRSVIEVIRCPTLKEPEEEVAQFITDSILPIDIAPIVDLIGRFYSGSDGQEALLAVEENNMGYAVQAELQRHLGYTNFFIWETFNKVDPARAKSNSIGWETNRRTRPMIVSHLIKKIRTVDAAFGLPDFQVNSPFTIEEMRDFLVPPGCSLGDAMANPRNDSAHDDCLMAAAIGLTVIQIQVWTSGETLDMQRKREAEMSRRKLAIAARSRTKFDYQNSDTTASEMILGLPAGLGKEHSAEENYWYIPDNNPFSFDE